MKTLTEAIDSVLDARSNRQDFDIPLRQFSLSLDTDGENIVGCIDGKDYVPTWHCLRQMAKWHNLPLGILRNLSEPVMRQNGTVLFNRDETDLGLLVQLFKNGIRDGRVDPDKIFKFRTYGDGTLRAMLSDIYATIDNVWYLEHLQDVFTDYPDGEVKFEHWSTNGDTIHGNLRIPGIEANYDDGEHGGMLFVGNCEIGTRRISIAPAVWRQICTNGMMGWAKGQMWDKVHRGAVDLGGLAREITSQITDKIKMIDSGIAALQGTREHEFVKGVKPSQVIAQVADEYKLTFGQKGQAVAAIGEYVNHESSFRNLYGVINAITRVAQEQEPAEQHRLEAVGGELARFSDKDWNRTNVLAGSMNEDKYNKILGRVAV
jgi:hypothetical protein